VTVPDSDSCSIDEPVQDNANCWLTVFAREAIAVRNAPHGGIAATYFGLDDQPIKCALCGGVIEPAGQAEAAGPRIIIAEVEGPGTAAVTLISVIVGLSPTVPDGNGTDGAERTKVFVSQFFWPANPQSADINALVRREKDSPSGNRRFNLNL
jgi:hypothetical protein